MPAYSQFDKMRALSEDLVKRGQGKPLVSNVNNPLTPAEPPKTPGNRADALTKLVEDNEALPSTSIGAPGAWARKGEIGGGLRFAAAAGDFIKPIVQSRREKLMADRAAAARNILREQQLADREALWGRQDEHRSEDRSWEVADKEEDRRNALAIAEMRAKSSGGSAASKTPLPALIEGKFGYVKDQGDNTSKILQAPEGVEYISPGETAADRAAGKKKGEIEVALPKTIYNAKRFSRDAREVLNDPRLEKHVGFVQGRITPFTEEGRGIATRIESLYGQTYALAYEIARGSGAITEKEAHQIALSLMPGLDRATSLQEYTTLLKKGIRNIEAQAGVAMRQAGYSWNKDGQLVDSKGRPTKMAPVGLYGKNKTSALNEGTQPGPTAEQKRADYEKAKKEALISEDEDKLNKVLAIGKRLGYEQ